MQKTALSFRKTQADNSTLKDTLSVSELVFATRDWLFDGEYRQHSKSTTAIRRIVTDKLLWFLRERGYEQCGTSELRQFLAYLSRGHEDAAGRWGNARFSKPVRPRTVHTYHGHLRTLFTWLVCEGTLDTSPMDKLAAPVSRSDQVHPFTQPQIEALLAAAKRSRHPRRDEAIILFLLDTGARVSELCALKMRDVDLDNRRCTVLGKGNKHRSLYFGKRAARALWQHLKFDARQPDEPLFAADRGEGAGEPLTRSGMLQLIKRLGRAANIQATRCSPHTFRHTFAVEFLRAGGNVFGLKELLGHTALQMVNRYVALAQADVENQHRQFSPGDRLSNKKT